MTNRLELKITIYGIDRNDIGVLELILDQISEVWDRVVDKIENGVSYTYLLD